MALVGSTGSGKTVAGLWHLSRADITNRPWVIFDFKKDPHIAQLLATPMPLGKMPKEPGLYVYRPIPDLHDAEVKRLLWRIWAQENVGVFVDEGFMLNSERNKNPALNACLTQGRSKNIQMIILSQRPSWVSRFVFSEADYLQVFRLNDQRDYDTIKGMTRVNIEDRLPPFHSYYYSVGEDKAIVLGPVPPVKEVIRTINNRLRQRIGVMV